MNFRRIWVLRGPNVWARGPVVEAELELHDRDSFRPASSPSVASRLAELDCRPTADATLADTLLAVVRSLLARTGFDCRVGLVHPTREPAFYRVVFDYDEEPLARAALDAALALCVAALNGEPFDVAAKLKELRDLAHEVRLGPSTGAIVRAAEKHGIPTRRLNAGSLVQLGWGARQHRIWTAETDQTSALAETIAQDKQLTRNLLQAVGVPVPYGRPVDDAEDAWRAAEEIGPPVVVKPQYGNQGRGVATDLRSRDQVLAAYAAAKQESSYIVVEKYVPGADHRLLVIGGKLVAAALREPAHVIGDGRSTIAQLIATVNQDPRRSDGHATSLSHIKLDAVSLGVLGEQGFTPDSIPLADTRVLVRRNANLSTGGTATDVTDRVHPDLAAAAVDAARAVGLDVAGVDVVACDVRRPLAEQGGAIVEVNAGPGLRMHLEPSAGSPRPVGEAIVASLFPPGETGRIPVAAVTGVNGKTTTARLLAHLLRTAGRYVGLTCTDGIYLNGRRIETRDCSGPHSARSVLLNPRVEAAVLETARGGILREGLGFDRCVVAVVTNVGQGDHLGLRGVETLDELARVKRVVVEAVAEHGSAVLNAADPLVAAMAPHCPGAVIFFTPEEKHPVVRTHRANGGRTAFVRAGNIVFGEGAKDTALLPLAEVPMTRGSRIAFQVENVLAAAAAAWALTVPLDVVRAAMKSFSGDAAEVPGRFNVFAAGEAVVIVDYAHNPSAVAALVAAVAAFPQRRRTLVFSGCDRRDADLRAMGALVGDGFDRVILYRDWGHGGRADGELNALLREGMAGKRVSEVVEVATEKDAVETALRSLAPDELVVLGIDSIEEVLALVQAHLSTGLNLRGKV